MYYEKESGTVNFVVGLALGAVLGASLALLTAPQSGRRTRKHIVRAVARAKRSAGDDMDVLAGRVARAARRRRRRVGR